MRTLYQAGSAIEAHMLVDLLKQQGLFAEIHGEHLQGAIGELPAAGLVRLVVDEPDYAAARELIERWESAQPAEVTSTPPPATRSAGWWRFAIGLAIGIVATSLYYRSPGTTDGIDRNHDGKVDYIAHYDRRGEIESAEADDDFDGTFETRIRFRGGNVELYEVDTDGDGIADRRSHYANGVLTTTEIINPATGVPLRVEHYRLGVLVKAEVDTDRDGVLDTRFYYTPLGEVSSSEKIQP